jgi:hypothetical protein
MCAMVGIGFRHLNKPKKITDYLSNAILPFYILNQPVMLVIAFYAVHWPIGIAGKFLVIAAGSLGLTMLLYDRIKNVELFRWLFGIPPKQSVSRLSSIVRRKKRLDKGLENSMEVR